MLITTLPIQGVLPNKLNPPCRPDARKPWRASVPRRLCTKTRRHPAKRWVSRLGYGRPTKTAQHHSHLNAGGTIRSGFQPRDRARRTERSTTRGALKQRGSSGIYPRLSEAKGWVANERELIPRCRRACPGGLSASEGIERARAQPSGAHRSLFVHIIKDAPPLAQ